MIFHAYVQSVSSSAHSFQPDLYPLLDEGPIYNETSEFSLQRRERKHPLAASRAFEDTKLTKHAIPREEFIFVGDGRKALFLRNEGDEKFAKFVTEGVLADENKPSPHDQGTDEPGRGFARANTSRRSAMESTDRHDIEKHRFAQEVAAALDRLVREGAVRALVIVAPPRTLVDLRKALDPTNGESFSKSTRISPNSQSGKSSST